jgi:serine/threonine protein kinase/tetratricopeptide (TPR) repeat protein
VIPENISHYRILSRIGAGGMGDVYLAEDTLLGRRVALKLLRMGFTKEEERLRRFEQEARLVSALNHPSIMTIYEIGHADSLHYIATEFIEGETLRQRLRKSRLPISEILDISIQVAGALAAAHQAGIVHRDIKPENIMLRLDGYIKILDFGLAKLTERYSEQRVLDPGATESLDAKTIAVVNTEQGVIMGSPHYMSPEQARGLAVDERTDIFSLGVVLYEMVTGRVPFEGATATDVIVSILEKGPPSMTNYTEQVPAELQRIIIKSLRKDREQRYQVVKDLLIDLKSLKQELELQASLRESAELNLNKSSHPPIDVESTRLVTVGPGAAAATGKTLNLATFSNTDYVVRQVKRHKSIFIAIVLLVAAAIAAVSYFSSRTSGQIDSIAVLPFVNVSTDPNTEYLSDGIAESLINSLSQLPSLKVMSRNAAFRYKVRDSGEGGPDPLAVGRELKVRAVLMGRVVQRGDTLLISTELVDARNNVQIWGQQYNRRFADIFTVQEEIARNISEKLRMKLTGEEGKMLAKHYTENTQAYQLYLQGRFYWNKRTPEGLTRGIEYFQRAIDLDPNYALAYAGLADCYVLGADARQQPKEVMEKAKAAALKALELDGALPEAYTSLAKVLLSYEWDWAGAENAFRKAIELNPNYPTARQWYGVLLSAQGRHDESIAQRTRALELDPLSLSVNSGLGRSYYWARRYDRAIEQIAKTLEMDPNYVDTHWSFGLAYEQKGQYERAISDFQRAVELSRRSPAMLAALGHAYGLAGRRAEAYKIAEELKAVMAQQYVSPYAMALVFAGLGENDQAFEWLEKAYQDRDETFVHLKVDPRLDRLRQDPRLTQLMKRINLAP